jgi:hypothetical protein
MIDEYEERLKQEVRADIDEFNKTGKLPREYDVRRIRMKPNKSKKKEKIEYGPHIDDERAE